MPCMCTKRLYSLTVVELTFSPCDNCGQKFDWSIDLQEPFGIIIRFLCVLVVFITQDIIGTLVALISGGSASEGDSALQVLEDLIDLHPKEVEKHSVLIKVWVLFRKCALILPSCNLYCYQFQDVT